MNLRRILRHLALPERWVLRRFPASTQLRIEQAIGESEKKHLGELRFVAEAGLPMGSLISGQSSRARSIGLFSQLGVWDTEHNSGVLIYLQLVDRCVEIVADRGINQRVQQVFWDSLCRELETAFRANQFETGVVQVVERISSCLQEHFPVSSASVDGATNPNELPDKPIII